MSMTSPAATASARSPRPNAITSSTSRPFDTVSWQCPFEAARTRVTRAPNTATSGAGFPTPAGSNRRSSWSSS